MLIPNECPGTWLLLGAGAALCRQPMKAPDPDTHSELTFNCPMNRDQILYLLEIHVLLRINIFSLEKWRLLRKLMQSHFSPAALAPLMKPWKRLHFCRQESII